MPSTSQNENTQRGTNRGGRGKGLCSGRIPFKNCNSRLNIQQNTSNLNVKDVTPPPGTSKNAAQRIPVLIKTTTPPAPTSSEEVIDWTIVEEINNAVSDAKDSKDASPIDLVNSLIPDQKSFAFYFASMSSDQSNEESLTSQLECLIDLAMEELSIEIDACDSYSGLSVSVEIKKLSGSSWELTPLEILTLFCRKLQVNLATVFASIELYNRFAVKFANKNLGKNDNIPMQISTCILLASKYHTDPSTRDVTVEKLRILLREHGEWYYPLTIKKSEQTTLGLLGFRVNWPSPFQLMENVLALLHLDVKIRRLAYRNSMSILVLGYQNHNILYQNLWDIRNPNNARRLKEMKKSGTSHETNGTTSTRDKVIERARLKFKRKVEMNLVMRAGGIVATALILINPKTGRDFSTEIGALLSTKVEDIYNFSKALLPLVRAPENLNYFK